MARVSGHISWWVFVVATLFAGGINWWGRQSTFAASFADDVGWTIYAPVRTTGSGYIDVQWEQTYDRWWQSPGVYGVIAFVIVVITAVTTAFIGGRIASGIGTVLVPFAALGLFVLATPDAVEGVELSTILSMLLVLVAIAIREVWMRAGPPAPARGTTQTS
ncbi:hypothetical protein BFL43_00170 [Williamsia sp. 1135]|nr:hypothetical protein BFL43_00170 [Williamsia sp. 1135]